MDHWEGLSTVFNHCFKIIMHYWATVDFVTQDGPFFHEIFKIFVVINQKLWGEWGQKLVWVVSTIGTTKTPSFVKIREVTQNSLLIWHGMTHILLFCIIAVVSNQSFYYYFPSMAWHSIACRIYTLLKLYSSLAKGMAIITIIVNGWSCCKTILTLFWKFQCDTCNFKHNICNSYTMASRGLPDKYALAR